jgi:hypothetical protein
MVTNVRRACVSPALAAYDIFDNPSVDQYRARAG